MSTTINTDDDEDDAPEAVLEAAFEDYAESGLRMPPVPRGLVSQLEEQAEWLYGTELLDLSDREEFLQAARAAAPKSRVALGHTGHGQASWYLGYQLIDGPLCVFVRQRYGTPYDDAELARTLVNNTVEGIEELVVRADEARDSGRLAAGQRLLVVIDDLEPGGIDVIGGTEGWQEDEYPLAAASRWLSAQ